ncbi:glycine zipper 2TM domain-containing protein [Palleronia sp. LCG004]|uniref:glycine zipper 2TM domain-containing protein n=1 Tax=Palleronia sp. LCG004 TaxID=3079304 RepID=UPI0029430626|nr:glycine zipper 2TM domain-containing protein [Palleronia sp. LCG004]WOI56071.1 glycine zipper 2TM domain-containing protein [Palleronia sp. LCG004]
MKKILIALPLIGLMAGCQSTASNPNQGALTGAALGAAAGAAVSGDDDRVTGALLGGAAGAAAGNYLGQARQPGQCRYQYPSGQVYTAPC